MTRLALLALALCACVPRPRASPFRPFTCDAPPELRAECPPDAFVDVVILSPDEMADAYEGFYGVRKTPAGMTLATGGVSFLVLVNEDRDHVRVFRHEVRCHIRALIDEGNFNYEHRVIDGFDCAND